jgi:uncharacterized cupredoxin-like copper-binding protein
VPKLSTVALSSAALALSLAACGGSSSSSSTASPASSSAPATSSSAPASAPATASTPSAAGGGLLTLAADPSGRLMFTKTTLSAKAGKVTIAFTNSSPLMHNMTIQQGTNGPVVGATPIFAGGTKTLRVTLKPGTYTFYCSVPGHRAAGMQGTLTVS